MICPFNGSRIYPLAQNIPLKNLHIFLFPCASAHPPNGIPRFLQACGKMATYKTAATCNEYFFQSLLLVQSNKTARK
jgi:hypothetical protein